MMTKDEATFKFQYGAITIEEAVLYKILDNIFKFQYGAITIRFNNSSTG